MLSLCLIEDNKKLWNLLQQALLEEWYACDWYTSAEKVSFNNITKYHIFIIDVMLPGEDGYSFAKRLREAVPVGIIFLTARWSLQDKQQWFEAGADDYIVKPFVTDELVMRIDSLSTRIKDIHYFVFNDISIDWKGREIKKGDAYMHLTPIEWEVLWYLLRNVWLVCNRTDIIEYVRGTDDLFSMSRSLDVTIANIRKKLDKKMIETITNVWYKIKNI